MGADRNGGLALILLTIPPQQRDLTQWIGRTARQDRRGQWMAVLNQKDYPNLKLTADTAVSKILSSGEKDTESKVRKIHGQFHRGLRMNEICEVVTKRKLLQD